MSNAIRLGRRRGSRLPYILKMAQGCMGRATAFLFAVRPGCLDDQARGASHLLISDMGFLFLNHGQGAEVP